MGNTARRVKGVVILWASMALCVAGMLLSLLVIHGRYYDLLPPFAWLFAIAGAGVSVSAVVMSRNDQLHWAKRTMLVLVVVTVGAGMVYAAERCWSRCYYFALSPQMRSKGHLSALGKALRAYSDHEASFPFDERGPLESLSLLYPDYLSDPADFESPVFSGSWFRRNEERPRFPIGTALAGQVCDYAYAWRDIDHDAPDVIVMACLPKTLRVNGRPDGYVVLRVDGHVNWQETVFTSRESNDNIYAPDPGLREDTDTWLRTEPLWRAQGDEKRE